MSGVSASRRGVGAGERPSHAHAFVRAQLSRSQPISADLSRSRVRQLRIRRSCTRAARSCSRSTPVARQIPIRLQSEATHVRSTPRSDCNQRPSAAISGHRRLPKSIRGHQGLHITCCSSLNPASFRRASQHASHAPRGAEREHTGQSPPKSSRSGGKWAKQWST